MKFEIILFLDVLTVVVFGKQISKRVINGTNAPKYKYQWAISLKGDIHSERSVTICGATLIHRQWLLSAAHCFHSSVLNQTDPSLWHVRAGSKDMQTYYTKDEKTEDKIQKDGWHNDVEMIEKEKDEWNELFKNLGLNEEFEVKRSNKRIRTGHVHLHVQKIILHPNYEKDNIEWDIALLKLDYPINEKYINKLVKVINLPKRSFSKRWPKKGQKCVLVGWGCTEHEGDIIQYGQLASLNILTNKYCERVYNQGADLNRKHEFCAGSYAKGHGLCEGDSGSGLACRKNSKWVLAGVASATHNENPANYPGIFTRVSYFVPWIQRMIKNN